MSITQKQKIIILTLENIIHKLKLREAGTLRSFQNLEYDMETLIKKNEKLSKDNQEMASYIISLTTKKKLMKELYGKKGEDA
jgi:hypothetical protein